MLTNLRLSKKYRVWKPHFYAILCCFLQFFKKSPIFDKFSWLLEDFAFCCCLQLKKFDIIKESGFAMDKGKAVHIKKSRIGVVWWKGRPDILV